MTTQTTPSDKPEIRVHRPDLPANASRSAKMARELRRFATHGPLHIVILTLVLVAVCILLATTKSTFLTTPNLVAILQTMAVLCIASIGQTIAIVAGGFDLSVGGMVPLAGVVFALTSNAIPGPSGFVVGIIAALVAGAIVGIINGLFITRLRVNPLITTLGTLSVAGGAAYVVGQGSTIILQNQDAGLLAGPIAGGLSWDVVIFVLLAGITSFVLYFTITGRVVYALGGSREAVRRAGIRASRAVMGVYISSALFATFAGIIAASQLSAAAPAAYSDAALSTITAVILGGAALTGGRGTVLGTVVGSLLLGVIANGLNLLQISTFYQTIITGTVLLVAVGLTKVRDLVTRTTDTDD